jgi:hypothetical protein
MTLHGNLILGYESSFGRVEVEKYILAADSCRQIIAV